LRDLLSDAGFDATGFCDEYGFEPALFPDYQALVGDSSDNVPGVPGFGPKTAGKLVAEYGGLEAVFKSVHRWSPDEVGVPSQGKLAANLAEHMEQALEMREVLRLAKNVPLPVNAMRRKKCDHDRLNEFLAGKKLRRVAAIIERTPDITGGGRSPRSGGGRSPQNSGADR